MPDVERHAREKRGEPKRTTQDYLSAGATYAELVREAARCARCDLYKAATRTVFGEGPVEASLMFVGEIPGDMEDRRGRPFVGPAGRLLDRALEGAGLDRGTIYLTNAVKHFKFELTGRRRQHRSPSVSEINACHYWLDRELALVKPRTVLALGGTAARAVFGKPVRVLQTRGRFVELESGRQAMVTIHPSAILRIPEDSMRRQAFEIFVSELRLLRDNG